MSTTRRVSLDFGIDRVKNTFKSDNNDGKDSYNNT